MGMPFRAWAVVAGGVVLAATVASSRSATGGECESAPAVVELGRRLFFDPAVSRSGTNSCASCHDPAHGWSSGRRRDDDDFTFTARHSQPILDLERSPGFHWDGEFPTVEDLVTARLGVPGGVRGLGVHGPGAAAGGSSGGGSYGGGGSGSKPGPAVPPAPPPPPPTSGSGATTSDAGGGTPDRPPTTTPPDAPPAPGDGRGQGGGGDAHAPKDPNGSKGGGSGASGTPAAAHHGGAGDEKPHGATQVAFRDDGGRRRVLDLVDLVPVATRVEEDGRYAEAFRAAFGSASVTTARLAAAIGAFCRSVRSTESDYDRFAAGDESALPADARRGLALFKGRAGCVHCHVVGPGRATFTDERYHVTGIVARSFGGPAGLPDADRLHSKVDRGRARITEASTEERAFKTPTLRDVAHRGPYMHDGSLPSLEAVVEFYARGGATDPDLDPAIKGFDASGTDVRDLVAFLRSVSSDVRPGLAPDLRTRARTTRVRILDAQRRPLAGLAVDAVPAGDSLPGDLPMLSPTRTLVTDEDGSVDFVPPRRTHTRLLLPDGLRAAQGDWIPDTCERLDLVLPVAGRADLVVVIVRPEEVPARLSLTIAAAGEEALERERLAKRGPGPLPAALAFAPRTVVFDRDALVPFGKVWLGRYHTWVPVGAPAVAPLAIPSGTGPVVRAVGLVPGRESRVDLRDP